MHDRVATCVIPLRQSRRTTTRGAGSIIILNVTQSATRNIAALARHHVIRLLMKTCYATTWLYHERLAGVNSCNWKQYYKSRAAFDWQPVQGSNAADTAIINRPRSAVFNALFVTDVDRCWLAWRVTRDADSNHDDCVCVKVQERDELVSFSKMLRQIHGNSLWHQRLCCKIDPIVIIL